jgi:endonuclease/exonuclease/phosphatase family metal-dependent hydrolase
MMDRPIRVATWNTWWRFGGWEEREAAMAAVLDDVDADVIALQEVWADGDDGRAPRLADQLGFHYAFQASPAPGKFHRRRPDDRSAVGNAVLSRWPIGETMSFVLPPGDAPGEGRIAVFASVHTPDGVLPVFVAHLNSGWAQSSIRATQLAATGRAMVDPDRAGDWPAVLCGDFNALPDFDEVRALSGRTDPLVAGLALLDAWEYVHPHEPGWTWDRRNPHVAATFEPAGRIDYVFVGFPDGTGRGQPVAARLFGTEPVDGVWPSDHFGVAVDLAPGGDAAPPAAVQHGG